MATTLPRLGGTKTRDPLDDVYNRWQQTQTTTDLRSVVDALNPLIQRAATTFAGANMSPLVISRARVLAARAIRSFDPRRGAKLQTHVMTQLQPLRRFASQSPQAIRRGDRDMTQIAALARAENTLRENLGREPSDLELADYSGISQRRMNRLRARKELSAYGIVGGNDPVIDRSDPEDAWMDYVYHDLDDISRKIVDYKLGRGVQPMANKDIAHKLKITPSAVSQRLSTIQNRLNEMRNIGETL